MFILPSIQFRRSICVGHSPIAREKRIGHSPLASEKRIEDARADRDIAAGDKQEAKDLIDNAQINARDAAVKARDALHEMSIDPSVIHTRPEIGAALRASVAATHLAANIARKPNKNRCDCDKQLHTKNMFVISTSFMFSSVIVTTLYSLLSSIVHIKVFVAGTSSSSTAMARSSAKTWEGPLQFLCVVIVASFIPDNRYLLHLHPCRLHCHSLSAVSLSLAAIVKPFSGKKKYRMVNLRRAA
jgi:uncharacterized membrane protein